MATQFLSVGLGREITRDEAITILEMNQKEGLVLQPSNTRDADFICSCCGCCCGMLGLHKSLPKPLEYWAANFHAVVDARLCQGCNTCEDWCQVGAIGVKADTQLASVNLDRCIGCGLCVANCPEEALSLEKNIGEVVPPQSREELYDIIMANKKGTLGKLMVTGKLILDAVTTHQTHLLKR